jgi:tripartite ATP-independent transporter DctM subunit
MLGSVLLPEMEKRGYKNPMTLGPLLGSAGLDIMIPPSALGVILAILGRFSVGKFLVAITLPGLLMAGLYVIYIVVRCRLQPHLAPPYDVTLTPFSEKVRLTIYYVLPLGTVFFLAIGLIFLGIATPTEAAAMGAMGCLILAIFYRKLSLKVFRESLLGTMQVTVMIYMIFTGSTAFAQILAYTGAAQGLVELSVGLPFSPLMVLISMQLVLLIMGCFMEPVSILMVTMPIFMPITKIIGFDPIWFRTIMLLTCKWQPFRPFGILLFVLKGVSPPHVTMGDVYRRPILFF